MTAAQTGTQVAEGDPVTMVTPFAFFSIPWQQYIFYRVAGSISHVYWDSESGMHAEQWTGPGSMTEAQTGTQVAECDPVTLVSDQWRQQLHVLYCDSAKDSIHIFWSRYSSNLIVENWTGHFIVAPTSAAADLVTMGT